MSATFLRNGEVLCTPCRRTRAVQILAETNANIGIEVPNSQDTPNSIVKEKHASVMLPGDPRGCSKCRGGF